MTDTGPPTHESIAQPKWWSTLAAEPQRRLKDKGTNMFSYQQCAENEIIVLEAKITKLTDRILEDPTVLDQIVELEERIAIMQSVEV
jgi:hypothetical protein